MNLLNKNIYFIINCHIFLNIIFDKNKINKNYKSFNKFIPFFI